MKKKWSALNAYFNILKLVCNQCRNKGEGSTARNSSAQKNCSTPKSRLLDTVRADVKKMKTARKSKKRHFEQMHFLDQNVQLLE